MGSKTFEGGLEGLVSVHATEISKESAHENPFGLNDSHSAADWMKQA
jgi:hypothetical protein